MSRLNKFSFIGMDRLHSVVERVDDVELLHGYLTGEPYIGAKFSTGYPGEMAWYKIVQLETGIRKTAIVERV